MLRLLSESMGNKKHAKVNNETSCLLYENELGGLDFEEKKFSTFTSSKRRGPSSNVSNIIYEEKTKNFNY